MATKYCPTHGSVSQDTNKCPQCNEFLQYVFDDQVLTYKEENMQELEVICQKCRTQHKFESNIPPTFCSVCGAKFKSTLPPTPPRVEAFNGNEIVISEMLAKVRITPSMAKSITVTITGDEEIKQKALVQQSGAAVMVKAPFPFGEGGGRQSGFSNRSFGGGVVITSGSVIGGVVSGTSMINGQLFIDGKPVDMDREIQVEVEVPFGTTVKVGKLVGTCHIGDVGGDLITNIQGMTKVLAGTMRTVNASISGSGDVEVNRIDGGSIEARVSGSGDIHIQDGNASAFNAFVSGSGDVTFRGVANTASMTVSGSGDIYLGECKTAPLKRKSGSGSIRVGRAPKDPESGFGDW